MRPLTVTEAKGKRRGGPPLASVPREGSKLRAIYDALMSGDSVPIDIGRRYQLEDFYGLDLELAAPSEHIRNAAGRQVAVTKKLWRIR